MGSSTRLVFERETSRQHLLGKVRAFNSVYPQAVLEVCAKSFGFSNSMAMQVHLYNYATASEISSIVTALENNSFSCSETATAGQLFLF